VRRALLAALGAPVPAAAEDRAGCGPRILVSSADLPALTLPEGITAWHDRLYVGTYNFLEPSRNRILVLDTGSGAPVRTLGGRPGQELVSAGALLGLTVDRRTGYLYANSNGTGRVLRIHRPDSDDPEISVVGRFAAGGGPEDMAEPRRPDRPCHHGSADHPAGPGPPAAP
jgi:hypothetical protein